MAYSNPIGNWAVPARVDMGVDYTGSGDLFAIGDGTIVNTHNSGWPGGAFITIKLDQPIGGNQYFYYAENITPSVNVGQKVTAGQKIGHANGSFPFIELGFAAPPGTGQTMAAATGQDSAGLAHGDPGAFPTGWGVAASDFIKSLGGKAGLITGSVRGAVPNLGSGGNPAPQQGGAPGASGLGGIFSIPSDIVSFFSAADAFVKGVSWLISPSHWIRIAAFLGGVVLLLFALRAFLLAAEGQSPVKPPHVMPVPV